MLQFLRTFAFYQLYQLSNRTPKITQIGLLKITPNTACQRGAVTAFSEEDKILIKMCMNVKATTPPQFTKNFPDKGWTKSSINRLLVKLRKFGTV